ncbi:TetR/AcrR family transcriptional regulator [Neobacillus vireti]|uniref:TetR/AcrR family transcriptional regulator n=1 Tax=Neobacillus vireti TaxID=220686 RepID=UPI002FFDDEB9
MNPKIDDRVKRTRKSFKDALLKCLSEIKFDTITIFELSNQAGYNRVTFYSHYQDKYQLLEELITDILDGFDREIANAKINDVQDPLTQPSTIAMFQYIYTNSNFFQLMLSNKRVPGFIPRFIQSLFDLYKDTVKPEKEEIDNVMYLYYVSGATFGVISHWVTTGFKYSPIFMAEQLTQIVFQRPQKILFKNETNLHLKLNEEKIDKRIVRTKSNFKASLLKLVSEKNFESITITEICEEAKYNRATFYSHYEDKIDLASELIDEVIQNLICKMNTLNDISENNDEQVKSIIYLFSYIQKHKKFFEIMLNGKTIPGSLYIIRGHLQEFFRKKVDILKDYSYTVEWEIFLAYITSATLGVISGWVYSGTKQTPSYMAEQLYLILKYKPIPK